MARGTTIVAVLAFGIVGGLAFGDDAASAQQFSADLVNTNAAGEATSPSGRIFVANGKARIETPDLPGSFLIVDSAGPAAYLVRPAQRIFMESKQSTRLTQIFVPLDPGDPCGRWQAMSEIAGAAGPNSRWRCLSIGHETIDRRDTIRYEVLSPRNRRGVAWIDPQLNFLLRIRSEDGAIDEIKNVQQGSQVAALFEIPENYRKFDPQQLINRIRQSDVWVEPPN